MSAPRFDVIGIGGCAWDLLGRVARYPHPGEKVPLLEFREQGGGQAATAVVSVARLGGRTAFVGTAGDDAAGANICREFEAEGVDTSHLFLDPQGTSHLAFCAVLDASGERAIFFTPGSKRRLQPADLDPEFLCSAGCLLLDTHHPEAHVAAAALARQAGIPVVTDLEHAVCCIEELLRLGTHPVLPERFLLEHTGETDGERAAIRLLERYQPRALVVTRGVRGSIGYQDDEIYHQPAYQVDRVVDTTGAGDVFHGAFAYGLVLGYDLPTNLEFASLVAGLKCRRLGGRSGLPTREELKELWRLPLPEAPLLQ